MELTLHITTILQENARTSNAEIARQVGLAPSAVFERIRKLEERGVLQGFHAQVDPHAAGLPLLAFVFVRSNERAGGVGTAERIAKIPEVLEVHHVAGEDCFLVKLRAADTEDARQAPPREVRNDSRRSPRRARRSCSRRVKESSILPLGVRGGERAGDPPCLKDGARRAGGSSSRSRRSTCSGDRRISGSDSPSRRCRPFLMAGTRHLTAGLILYAWTRSRGAGAAEAARLGARRRDRRDDAARRQRARLLGRTARPVGRWRR